MMKNTDKKLKIVYPKSVDQLIQRLKDKELTIENDVFAKKVVSRIGYSNFKKYRKPIYDTKLKKYTNNSTINDIETLYNFDLNIKMIFLKYFLKVENKFRDFYKELVLNEFENRNILSETNYNNRKRHDLKKFFEEIKKISQTRFKWNAFYINNGYEIPSWLIVDCLHMGKILSFFEFLKPEERIIIGKNFSKNKKIIIRGEWILSFLKTLSNARNICVHNEPLFSNMDFQIKKDSVEIFKKYFDKKQITNNIDGSIGLGSLIIVLKLLLDHFDFEKFILEFDKELRNTKKYLNKEVYVSLVNILMIPKKYKKMKDVVI